MSSDSEFVVVGMECRVPGGNGLQAFSELLFNGRSGIADIPAERFDRNLYFDARRGQPGKAYTTLGGCVPESLTALTVGLLDPELLQQRDPAHLQFCDVAVNAWYNAGLRAGDSRLTSTGIYVGHSGGTKLGGPLSLATQIEEAVTFLEGLPSFARLSAERRKQLKSEICSAVRKSRPGRSPQRSPRFHAYEAASVAAGCLQLKGPRCVIDAACASSLVALSHAIQAIEAGRTDSAIVGGATYNSVDNLILFSQSQACSEDGSRPFDDRASGLVSSEGYVAVVITTLKLARLHGLPVLGIIRGIGTSSDGRGKSLWAPRTEGQVLALRRAADRSTVLDIDYLECHATSTQLGDATELETLRTLTQDANGYRSPHPLLLGSVKSNIGHTLEAAGLIGLVKVLLSMQRRSLPPSLNFEQPNRKFDWTTAPFKVVDRRIPWVRRSSRMRAGISAFGIGGLNAHLIVEEPAETSDAVDVAGSQGNQAGRLMATQDSGASMNRAPADRKEPIAIVGRGIVCAGALNTAEFGELLGSGRSALGAPPPGRWKDRAGVQGNDAAAPFCSPTDVGGYVTDFRFDGQPYRIPPRQVQQSNPVQMMLVDAVTQCLGECAGSTDGRSASWPFDRARISVVIGSIFGGEFGDDLQVGMRIPELQEYLIRGLQKSGISGTEAEELAAAWRKILLQNRPALLDETGSFTASTLASRLAKTFDLMGGACALDGDDASSLSALLTSVDLLRAGSRDLVVCGTSQRAMNLSAFEQLDITGRLVRTGMASDIPEDCSRILPGEGVAVLFLCRLSDARAKGLPILGVVDDVRISLAAEHREILGPSDAALVRQIGYLSGAHSLIRIIAQTIQWESGHVYSESCVVSARAADGLLVQSQIIRPESDNRDEQVDESSVIVVSPSGSGNAAPSGRLPGLPPKTQVPCAVTSMKPALMSDTADGSLKKVRFSACSAAQMVERAEALLRTSGETSGGFEDSLLFDRQHEFRCTFLYQDRIQLQERLAGIVRFLRKGRFCGVLERERAVLWRKTDEAVRVAWLFPGQGSHYAGMPSVLAADRDSREDLAGIDRMLAEQGLEPLSRLLGSADFSVGDHIWWAQMWVLGMSRILTRVLKRRGYRPDVVLGHSFGEFCAAEAAGVMTAEDSVVIARSRANALTMHVREPGGLLSVRSDLAAVDALIRRAGLGVYVTHQNSPRQTVVAGTRRDIELAAAEFSRSGIASMSVPVPAAFHTPLLSDAQAAFGTLISDVRLKAPCCGFLSATTVRYLAEPDSLRSSLVSQLTQPVHYSAAVSRLRQDGCRVFIEIGPNDVLTRLNREILPEDSLCLSLDVPGQPYYERMEFVDAVMECVDLQQSPVSFTSSVRTEKVSVEPQLGSVSASQVVLIDVTRSKNRASEAKSTNSSVSVNGVGGQALLQGIPTRSPEKDLSTETSLPASSEIPNHGAMQVSAPDTASVSRYLLDLVVELTGYSPDVVDFSADLEADLGIDSIKKAQIIGELFSWSGITAQPTDIRLDDIRCLDDIGRLAGARTWADNANDVSTGEAASMFEPISGPDIQSWNSVESAAAGTAREALNPVTSPEQLENLLIDFVVDQTGYSRDIVDLDADLEADLGVDSIKLAQLIGEMKEQFGLHHLTIDRVAQVEFRTLRAIRDFLMAQMSGSVQRNGVSVSETSSCRETVHHQQVNGDGDVRGKHGFAALVPAAANSRVDSGYGYHVADESVSDESENDPLDCPQSEWGQWLLPQAAVDADVDSAYRSGLLRGRRHQKAVRAVLRFLTAERSFFEKNTDRKTDSWSSSERAELRGIADGAGVSPETVLYAAAHLGNLSALAATEVCAPSGATRRFALRVVSAPQRSGMPEIPELHGAALILGDGDFARELASRIRDLGHAAFLLSDVLGVSDTERQLQEIWQKASTPHLFLATPFDQQALASLNWQDWSRRRPRLLESPFRVCQLWMQRMIEQGLMQDASVVAVTRLGGDFGFSGQHVASIEAIGGLVKAMLIESWMRGYRSTPMKVIDVSSACSHAEAVRGVLRELAVPSYDIEIALDGNERKSVQAIEAPLEAGPGSGRPGSTRRITRGGVWIVSGGGRGITAVTAMRLAQIHGLKLHLLGTAPVPSISDQMAAAAAADRSAVRRLVMQDATKRGENPVECWRNTEKAIEVDATLRLCRSEGIAAEYHCCDVSDPEALAVVLNSIRRKDGPIRGVLHGAGAGQDSRFDRKRPEKVDRCLKAKIDGTLALMQATISDPLEWFVGYGSISGRFGANGHTDYSLANDMMAKIIDRYRMERPEVRSFTFHWHAWGDIGMATKPEAKLALEMIDMEFMPAEDGVRHFLNEFAAGGNEPEVLITDHSYFRKFYPADRMSEKTPGAVEIRLPLLQTAINRTSEGQNSAVVTLNPVTDRFLSQHTIQGRPALPFVVALELMAEVSHLYRGHHERIVCYDAEALQALRFATNDAIAVTLTAAASDDGGVECRLLSDIRRRDGRLVEENREFFHCTIRKAAAVAASASHERVPTDLKWESIEYQSPDALIYHGPELQELRRIAVSGDVCWGRIAASAPVQLFGADRAAGFTVPCATMDACLYAVAVFAWRKFQRPSLPVRFSQIEFGRLPDPGEPCLVRIECRQEYDRGAVFQFRLTGNNGDLLLQVDGYRVAWLSARLTPSGTTKTAP